METATLLGGIAVQRGLTLWRSQACRGAIVCGSRASARNQAHYGVRSGMLSVVGEPARLYLGRDIHWCAVYRMCKNALK